MEIKTPDTIEELEGIWDTTDEMPLKEMPTSQPQVIFALFSFLILSVVFTILALIIGLLVFLNTKS